MKKILFITTSVFPSDTAMSVRYFGLAKILQEAGWDVLFITRGALNDQKVHTYNGIPFLSVSVGNSKVQKILDIECRVEHEMKRQLQSQKIGAILVAGASTRTLKFLKKYSRSHRECILLHDSVEWYSPEQFKQGKYAPEYRKKNYWMTKGLIEDFRIIAISRYLEDYFQTHGAMTVRIPAIMDVQNIPYSKHVFEEKCVIMYAGSPGKKDFIAQIIDGINMLSEDEKNCFELRLVGINKEQLTSNCGVPEYLVQKLAGVVKCLGKVPREQVLENLQTADFTILLRPSEARYAKAGFPTKVPESLSTGTPVICNLTSDLGEFLTDGENALVLKDESAESACDALQRAIHLTREQREVMCKCARNTAEKSFDYRLYTDAMREFLEKQ